MSRAGLDWQMFTTMTLSRASLVDSQCPLSAWKFEEVSTPCVHLVAGVLEETVAFSQRTEDRSGCN